MAHGAQNGGSKLAKKKAENGPRMKAKNLKWLEKSPNQPQQDVEICGKHAGTDKICFWKIRQTFGICIKYAQNM